MNNNSSQILRHSQQNPVRLFPQFFLDSIHIRNRWYLQGQSSSITSFIACHRINHVYKRNENKRNSYVLRSQAATTYTDFISQEILFSAQSTQQNRMDNVGIYHYIFCQLHLCITSCNTDDKMRIPSVTTYVSKLSPFIKTHQSDKSTTYKQQQSPTVVSNINCMHKSIKGRTELAGFLSDYLYICNEERQERKKSFYRLFKKKWGNRAYFVFVIFLKRQFDILFWPH